VLYNKYLVDFFQFNEANTFPASKVQKGVSKFPFTSGRKHEGLVMDGLTALLSPLFKLVQNSP
jgi:hypothetical protein